MFEEVKNMTTEELLEYVRKDYERRVDEDNTDYLFAVLEELSERRKAEGVVIRPAEEAWAEFARYYMPREDAVAIAGENLQENLVVPHTLTPSLGGKECLGNGKWLGYECQCCDCDWYATICFPEDDEQNP